MKIEVNNLNVEEVLFSGECFRARKESDGSITNILKDRVINIKQDGNILTIESSNYDNLKEVIYEYFDLNRDYNKINSILASKDENMKSMIDKCLNFKILNQDSFEMCISYIISQNNNVKRISNSVEQIALKYGKAVKFKDKVYHLFPTYEELKTVTSEEFKTFGVGFRDKYIVNYLNSYNDLKDIDKLSTEAALKELMKVKGIGLKVASCILLFGYKRLDVFPIDTWVKQYMVEHYNIKDSQKEIEKFAREKFGEYSGLVIQYMFHSQRNM